MRYNTKMTDALLYFPLCTVLSMEIPWDGKLDKIFIIHSVLYFKENTEIFPDATHILPRIDISRKWSCDKGAGYKKKEMKLGTKISSV